MINDSSNVVLVNPNSAIIQIMLRLHARSDLAPITEKKKGYFTITAIHPTKEKSDCVREEFDKEYKKFIQVRMSSFSRFGHKKLFKDLETDRLQ